MVICDADIAAAEQRLQQSLANQPRAVEAHYDRRATRVMITLSNGLELALPPHLAEGLANATPEDLAEIEITPTGLGLHWPKLDADLLVPALLEGMFGSARWMAALQNERTATEAAHSPVAARPR